MVRLSGVQDQADGQVSWSPYHFPGIDGPLGKPVVPLVYRMNKGSSSWTVTAGKGPGVSLWARSVGAPAEDLSLVIRGRRHPAGCRKTDLRP